LEPPEEARRPAVAPPEEVWREAPRAPLVLPEGIEAGLIGGLAVAAVFFVRDAWIGDPMQTPSMLGALLVAGAMVAGRMLSSLLFGVSPTDPVVLGGVFTVAAAVAVAACVIPGRRAAQLQPAHTLRD